MTHRLFARRSAPPGVLVVLLSALAVSCGGKTPAANTADATDSADATDTADATDSADATTDPVDSGAAAAPTTFAEQVALGGTLFGENCASCHGASGEGTGSGPRVVGLAEGALPLEPPADAEARTTKFVTVADVAAFVTKTMPPGDPGSLSADQYWAILAFDLKANGIELDQKLTPELAATLTIPRK